MSTFAVDSVGYTRVVSVHDGSWRAPNSRSGTVTVTDLRDNSLTTVCDDQFYYRATVFGAFDTYLLAFTDDEPGSFHAFDTRNLAWVGLLDTDRPIRCAHIY